MQLFLFSQLNPLDSVEVQNIKACDILGDNIHFQVLDEHGKTYLKKVKRTQFIMTQIEQFSITIEANI